MHFPHTWHTTHDCRLPWQMGDNREIWVLFDTHLKALAFGMCRWKEADFEGWVTRVTVNVNCHCGCKCANQNAKSPALCVHSQKIKSIGFKEHTFCIGMKVQTPSANACISIKDQTPTKVTLKVFLAVSFAACWKLWKKERPLLAAASYKFGKILVYRWT